MTETDVAIVGAGPVGLFAVFECGMLKMRCHVFDALDMPGGQCTALYPEKPIYDVPGYPKIEALALVERLAEQAAPFHPVYHLGAPVTGLARVDGGFRLTTAAGISVAARAVIVAAGGGDSAVDWAISLSEVAERVMVVHRRTKFRAAPESAARLEALAKSGSIELVIPYQLHGFEGEDGKVRRVVVADLDGKTRAIETDCLLPFFGLSMNLGAIAEWGLNLDRNHITVEPATCATSASGIFAIGDIATYPAKLKLILSGFAEAAQAAHAIYPLVHPGEALHFEYSTTKGVPGRS